MERTLYDVLEISRTTSPDGIRVAYLRLARKYHQYASLGDTRAEESLKQIHTAYQVLINPKERERYDKFLLHEEQVRRTCTPPHPSPARAPRRAPGSGVTKGIWPILILSVIFAFIAGLNSVSSAIGIFIISLIVLYVIYRAIPKSSRNGRNWGTGHWVISLFGIVIVPLFVIGFVAGMSSVANNPGVSVVSPTPVENPPEATVQPAVPYATQVAQYQSASADVYDSTVDATVYTDMQPPYVGGTDNQIILDRNDKATNPTWQQVKDFITQDNTDHIPYTFDFVCGDFAERVYDNAEARGIRTAFVTIHFADNSSPHAINVFQTTDRGLVYIDSTGVDTYSSLQIVGPGEKVFGIPTSKDKIGYVQVGQPYGAVSLSTNYGTKYSDFVKWQTDKSAFDRELREYNTEMAAYNNEVTNYNNQVTIYNVNPTSGSEYIALNAESNNLDSKKNDLAIENKNLDADASKLGSFWVQKGETVSSIEMYW